MNTFYLIEKILQVWPKLVNSTNSIPLELLILLFDSEKGALWFFGVLLQLRAKRLVQCSDAIIDLALIPIQIDLGQTSQCTLKSCIIFYLQTPTNS